MENAHGLLQDLAVVLCVAAVTTVLFQWLKQPVVLGYVLAGLIVGPHIPIPLIADKHNVETLSELGVILLMFSLGLEFSLRKLLRVGPKAALITTLEVGTMLWLGFTVARLLGWSVRESIFTGAIVAISSTMIIAKVFQEQKVDRGLADLVFGILVVEDLAAILLMTVLTALAKGLQPTTTSVLDTVLRLGGFLAGVIVVGLFVVPRAMRAIIGLKRTETTLVASVGICFATALLAQEMGYSVALGAFVAGSLIAEAGVSHQVERLIEPIRDMFGAVFFVSVGMLIDPALILQHWPAVVVLSLVVISGKVVGATVGAFVSGNPLQTSLRAGMSLAQIGEFSFIIAGLGLAHRVTGDFLFPVAVAVSAITTFTTPWLIRASMPLALAIDRHLPKPLQTFVSLYGDWVARLGVSRAAVDSQARRLIKLIIADGALVVGVVIGTSIIFRNLLAELAGASGLTETVVGLVIFVCALLVLTPLFWGLVSAARKLGQQFAEQVLPKTDAEKLDIAATPRRVLVLAMQLAILIVVGIPIVAVTQPFLPPFGGVVVLVVPLIVLAVMLWRSANNLQGHVRAGAAVILEVIAKQSAQPQGPDLSHAEEMLPGIGSMESVRIEPGCAAVGRTLAALNVRGLTGATVVAVRRGEQGTIAPTGHEPLQANDVLAIIGSEEAVKAARELLSQPGTSTDNAAA